MLEKKIWFFSVSFWCRERKVVRIEGFLSAFFFVLGCRFVFEWKEEVSCIQGLEKTRRQSFRFSSQWLLYVLIVWFSLPTILEFEHGKFFASVFVGSIEFPCFRDDLVCRFLFLWDGITSFFRRHEQFCKGTVLSCFYTFIIASCFRALVMTLVRERRCRSAAGSEKTSRRRNHICSVEIFLVLLMAWIRVVKFHVVWHKLLYISRSRTEQVIQTLTRHHQQQMNDQQSKILFVSGIWHPQNNVFYGHWWCVTRVFWFFLWK